MAKKRATKSSKKLTKRTASTEDKSQLKRAALFYWSHAIYVAAEKAGQAVGGFEKAKGNGDKFYCVVQKMKEFIKQLERVAETGLCWDEVQARLTAKKVATVRLARVHHAGPMAAEGAGQHCTMDEHCPDGQICVYGDCESPFS